MFSSCPALAMNPFRSDGRAHSGDVVKGQPRPGRKGTRASGHPFEMRFPWRLSMHRRDLLCLPAALAMFGLASCGEHGQPAKQANGATAMDNSTISKINVASDAFRDGQPIPAQFTCDGANQSPRISWGEPPAGTKSFA